MGLSTKLDTQVWYGNSHEKAWNQPCKSFSELANHPLQPRSLKAGNPTVAKLPPAGADTASQLLRGTGTFQFQKEWSLGSPSLYGAAINGTTETKSSFRPPPTDARPPASFRGVRPSQFPPNTYPSDFRTTKQVDFSRERAQSAGPPPRPFRPGDSGRVYGQDAHFTIAEAFSTQKGLDYRAKTAEMISEAHKVTGGAPNHHPAGYNIITGAMVCHNNIFEAWERGRDYRRRR